MKIMPLARKKPDSVAEITFECKWFFGKIMVYSFGTNHGVMYELCGGQVYKMSCIDIGANNITMDKQFSLICIELKGMG